MDDIKHLRVSEYETIVAKERDPSKIRIIEVDDVTKHAINVLHDSFPERQVIKQVMFNSTLVILKDMTGKIRIVKNRYTLHGGVYQLIN